LATLRGRAPQTSKPGSQNQDREECRSITDRYGNRLPFHGLKKQIASIATLAGKGDICLPNQRIGSAMDRLRYEPFGERLAPEGDAAQPSRASRYLLWGGTGLFWSLVGGIVIARAVFFEPGVFDEFQRVASLVKAAIF
jgi:hypothetical protein